MSVITQVKLGLENPLYYLTWDQCLNHRSGSVTPEFEPRISSIEIQIFYPLVYNCSKLLRYNSHVYHYMILVSA